MMRPLESAPRTVFGARCPHCTRRLHAPSQDELRRQMERHLRNCNAFKQAMAREPCPETTESGGG